MAKRRGKGKRRTGGPAAVPIVPTTIALIPELIVGMKAGIELAGGANPAEVGQRSIERLAQLYGGRTVDPSSFGVKENATMKGVAAVTHYIMRKAGMRVRLSKRYTIF